jgi:hypothetical protein
MFGWTFDRRIAFYKWMWLTCSFDSNYFNALFLFHLGNNSFYKLRRFTNGQMSGKAKSRCHLGMLNANNLRHSNLNMTEWEMISCKQSTRWQHLSQLKASVFLSLQKKYLVVKKCNNVYLWLVMPSSEW